MFWCALVLVLLIWSAAIIWAAWRARWIFGAIIGLASVVGTILAGQWIGGSDPVGYGVTLGLSIFLAAAMLILGLIATMVKFLARRERG